MKNREFFNDYIKAFLNQNAKLNLISKNDEKFLWEKHIYDSLAIEKFFEKYGNDFETLLDFGTGGGFPAVPIALCFPEIQVTAVDSIRKKINAICEIKEELNIKNLIPVCGRVENLQISPLTMEAVVNGDLHTTAGEGFDIVTSRAVASLDKIVEYAMPRLKKDGFFIAYKSVKAREEIEDAHKALKKYKAKVVDIIEYDLPLEENHTRNLIVIKNV